MPKLVGKKLCHIPRHHAWFLSRVCNDDVLTYLANRRLLETTLFAIPCAHASAVPRMPEAPTTFADLPWADASPLTGFTLNGSHAWHDAPSGQTTFRALQYEDSLYVMVRCEDPAGIAKMPGPDHVLFNGTNLHMLPYFSDYVTLMVDPHNDHTSCWQFTGTPSGGKLTSTLRYGGMFAGPLAFPVNPLAREVTIEEQEPGVTANWELQTAVDDDRRGWTAWFRIPLSLLGDERAPVLGFNVCRFKQSMPPEQSAWSDPRWLGENFHALQQMGDLYLDNVPIAVRHLWLGEGLAGQDRALLEVTHRGTTPIRTTWRIACTGAGDRRRALPAIKISLQPSVNLVELPYDNTGGRLRISAQAGSATTPFFTAEYDVKAYPRQGEGEAPPPAATARDYDVKKRIWLCTQLPRLMRVTTADGASSDFCLADTGGQVLFDLMQPGAIRQIARMLEARFGDPDDRLAAADLLLRQPDLYVYEYVDHFGDQQSSGLSVLRLGTGICGARATIMKEIVEALRPPGGGRYRAYRCGIMQWHEEHGRLIRPLGHCQLLVVCPDGRQIFLNPFGYRPKDRQLAGPDDTAVFARVNGWAYDPDHLLVIDTGSRTWPDGAPPV